MRKGWTYRKLGDICEVINGLWTGKKAPFITVAVIRNTNFSKDCRLKLDDVAYLDVETKQYSSRKLKPGDIIIEKSGGSEKQPVGRPVLFDIEEGDYSFSNFTATLRIKEGEIVNPTFLHRCLYGHYVKGETLRMQSKTTGLHNLDMKAFLRLPIPNLPVAEQERIVAELDLLQGIIDKQKAQLKELDTLAQSIFYDMFGDPVENERGWTVYQLFELVTEDCPISYGIVQPGDGEKIGVPVVRPVDLTTTFVHNNGLKLTTEAISNAYKRTILKGDELLLCVRGTTGIVSLAAEDLIGCNVSRGITPLRFKTANRFFMLYQFKTPMIQRIVSELTHGIALKGMNMSDVRKMRFICPPMICTPKVGHRLKVNEKE